MSDKAWPEHEKLKGVHDQSQTIGSFLDGMSERGLYLCENSDADGEGRFFPTFKRIEEVLAEYFGIDLKKLEREKVAMLDAIRKANPPTRKKKAAHA